MKTSAVQAVSQICLNYKIFFVTVVSSFQFLPFKKEKKETTDQPNRCRPLKTLYSLNFLLLTHFRHATEIAIFIHWDVNFLSFKKRNSFYSSCAENDEPVARSTSSKLPVFPSPASLYSLAGATAGVLSGTLENISFINASVWSWWSGGAVGVCRGGSSGDVGVSLLSALKHSVAVTMTPSRSKYFYFLRSLFKQVGYLAGRNAICLLKIIINAVSPPTSLHPHPGRELHQLAPYILWTHQLISRLIRLWYLFPTRFFYFSQPPSGQNIQEIKNGQRCCCVPCICTDSFKKIPYYYYF